MAYLSLQVPTLQSWQAITFITKINFSWSLQRVHVE